MEILAEILQMLADYFLQFGYLGIFILMFIESSFVPFPSEIVMIPAGYFAALGQMNIVVAILAGTAGSLGGAVLNYYLSLKIGREILLKFKIIKKRKIEKAEEYFERYGAFSTFVGRLLPVVRQYISIPAGVCRMNFVRFCLYTTFGAGLWVTILAIFGYVIGDNKDAIMEMMQLIKFGTVIFVLVLVVVVVGMVLVAKKRVEDD
jgi:membrane protein DedA with SNARE-associated domain